MIRHKYITRIDKGRTHGWWVRFQKWSRGKAVVAAERFFSDGKYGGKSASLGAAVTWRDEQLPHHPVEPRRAGKQKTGRKLQPIGYENVIEFQRTMTRGDGSTYQLPTLLAKIKLTKTKFAKKQLSYGGRSKAAALRDIEAWLSEQREKLAGGSRAA